jgi:DNA-directed RNA polymerase specialized sigma24 family protein
MFERYHLEHESSYEDLAREFGVPLTTVTNRLAAMRREFRNLLLARLRETSSGEDEYRADAKLLLG